MTIDDYYAAPPQKVFDEIKAAALTIWSGYDNAGGYRDGKIERIANLQNIQDNAWYMVAMFDHVNQGKLLRMVSEETAAMILDARGY